MITGCGCWDDSVRKQIWNFRWTRYFPILKTAGPAIFWECLLIQAKERGWILQKTAYLSACIGRWIKTESSIIRFCYYRDKIWNDLSDAPLFPGRNMMTKPLTVSIWFSNPCVFLWRISRNAKREYSECLVICWICIHIFQVIIIWNVLQMGLFICIWFLHLGIWKQRKSCLHFCVWLYIGNHRLPGPQLCKK